MIEKFGRQAANSSSHIMENKDAVEECRELLREMSSINERNRKNDLGSTFRSVTRATVSCLIIHSCQAPTMTHILFMMGRTMPLLKWSLVWREKVSFYKIEKSFYGCVPVDYGAIDVAPKGPGTKHPEPVR